MSDRLALLERAQQGDGSAEAQLLTENAGLIWSIVRRYNGCGVETDDLYQLGCIGFVKAVKGFDLTDRKSTRLNSSHLWLSRMPSSA